MSVADQATTDPSDAVGKQLLALPSIRTRLEFQFALLSAAGGLVLTSGQGTESIALLAVFTAAFGFIFVDWLRLFELPPVGAYLAMGCAAAYCVQDFWVLQERGEPQMQSVALLLVLVQGVLMLQHKSRRILEQLAVFCLLELVVAAIFNDAINFGLLMIPITIVGGSALSLLGLVMLMEGIDVTLDRPPTPIPKTKFGRLMRFIAGRSEDVRPRHPMVAASSPESIISIYQAAGPWSRYAVLSLAPAVFFVAAAFFYVLPRKIEPSRSTSGGPALVGFDDEIRLEQLGQVMQNPKTALKIKLTDARVLRSGVPYIVNDSLYLRGKVLEQYEVDYSSRRPVAKWVSTDQQSLSRRSKLPRAYRGRDSSPSNQFDNVMVEIACAPMSRPALFSITPYHAADEQGAQDDDVDVVHAIDRWTISRKYPEPPFPRVTYRFGTHAFFNGGQTRWIAQAPERERVMTSYGLNLRSILNRAPTGRGRRFYNDLLRFDRASVPSAVRLAQRIIETIPPTRRTQAVIADQLEVFLATDAQFSYTLNLDAAPIPNVDPIEQFLSVDRRGHCQYFASALALMLRSVGIPCRIVVGYRTEEYNPIGDYYIARQQHAHAWVEALIDKEELPADLKLAGQRPADRYWMRLDPTPAASAIDDGNREGVDGIVNMANNIWEDYVVEMDSERQSSDLVQATGLGEVQSSYRSAFDHLEQTIAEIRAGRLGGGRLSPRGRLPLGPILIAAGVVALFLILRRMPFPKAFRRRRRAHDESTRQNPELRFYADALKQLERVGIKRGRHETPEELRRRAGPSFSSLGLLTEAFQRCRYGHFDLVSRDQLDGAYAELKVAVDKRLAE